MKTSIDVTGQKTKTKEEEEVMTLTLRQTMLFVTCTHKSLLKTGYKKRKKKKETRMTASVLKQDQNT